EQCTNGQCVLATSNVSTALRAVGGDPTVYAAGDNGTLLQLSGGGWMPVPQPLLAGKNMTGVTSETFVGNVNYYFSTADGSFIKASGGTFSAITDPALSGKVLHGVSSTDNGIPPGREATVVGDNGFILRWTTGNPSTKDNTNAATTTASLRGVWSGS